MKKNNSNEMILNKITDKGFKNYNNKKYLSKALQKYLDEKIRVENEYLFMDNVEKIQELLIQTDNINDVRNGKISNTAKNSHSKKIHFNQEINQYNTNINFYFPNNTYASEINKVVSTENKVENNSKRDISENLVNQYGSNNLITFEKVENNYKNLDNNKLLNSDQKSYFIKTKSKIDYKHSDKANSIKDSDSFINLEDCLKEKMTKKDKLLIYSNNENIENLDHSKNNFYKKDQLLFPETAVKVDKIINKTKSNITDLTDFNNDISVNSEFKSSKISQKDNPILVKDKDTDSDFYKPMKLYESQLKLQNSKKDEKTKQVGKSY